MGGGEARRRARGVRAPEGRPAAALRLPDEPLGGGLAQAEPDPCRLPPVLLREAALLHPQGEARPRRAHGAQRGAGVEERGVARTRAIRPARRDVRGPSRPAPHHAPGRLGRASAPQGLRGAGALPPDLHHPREPAGRLRPARRAEEERRREGGRRRGPGDAGAEEGDPVVTEPRRAPENPTMEMTSNKEVLRRIEYTGDMLLNMGPQHPSTHGVINFLVQTDGEVMKRAIPEVGYLHRSIEKIGEKCTYNGFMPYTDRVDYIAAMFANQGWAMAVERLLGVEGPQRAAYRRVIACELNRISSHLISVGTMAMDIGAVTPFPYALRERESINDLIEALCGARLTYNYHRIGGVAFDMPDDWADLCRKWLDHFDKILDEGDGLISFSEIFAQRLAGMAPISKEMAIDYGLVGP